MYKFGDVIHAQPPNTSTVNGGGLVYSRSRAPKESRSEYIKALQIVPNPEIAPKNERDVEVSKGGAHVSIP